MMKNQNNNLNEKIPVTKTLMPKHAQHLGQQLKLLRQQQLEKQQGKIGHLDVVKDQKKDEEDTNNNIKDKDDANDQMGDQGANNQNTTQGFSSEMKIRSRVALSHCGEDLTRLKQHK